MGLFDVFGIDYTDYLAPETPDRVAGFYRRLAGQIEQMVGKGNSLASILLLHWLDGKGIKKQFDSRFVKDLQQVNDYLFTTVRSVFLTKEKVAHTKAWGGIKPRLKRTGKFTGTEPKRDAQGDYEMMYEGPPITPIKLSEFVEILKKYQKSKSLSEKEKRELDIFTSLHTFGLQSNVIVRARPKPQGVPVNASGQIIMSKYDVEFKSWTTKVVDDYDWNVKLGFPIPNPDYNSKDSGAIAPSKETVVIYHENARRVENAGLAVPYKVTSDPWTVTEKRVIDGEAVDLAGFKG